MARRDFKVFGAEFRKIFDEHLKEQQQAVRNAAKETRFNKENIIQICLCGRTKAPQYDKCWGCMKDDAVNEAYTRGFQAGELKQAKFTQQQVNKVAEAFKHAFSTKRLSQLISLCHPDRHNNSPASNEITVWLLEMRKRL